MGKNSPAREMVLAALSDGSPRSCRDVVEATDMKRPPVYNALYRCYKLGLVLRTKNTLYMNMRGES